MARNWKRIRWAIPFLAAAVAALVGLVVMSLWNWLMPALFAARPLTFWQALGLMVLARLLFGGFRGRPGGGGWRRRMRERWEEMTPEEREHFRAAMRRRGCEPPAAAAEPEARA
jgi:hypothetical protein